MPPLLEAPVEAPPFGDVLRLADDPTRARVLRQISVANGNSYIQRLLTPSAPIQRENTPAGTPVAKTELSSLDDAVKTIYDTLEKPVDDQKRETAAAGGARETVLRVVLDHHLQAADLQKKYTETYKTQLMDHVQQKMQAEDVVRVDEYLNHGQMRSVAKFLLAIDGAGTDAPTAFRALTDAHNEGKAEEAWKELVGRPLKISQSWASYTLDTAIQSDFSGNDLDKARALLKWGEVKGIAKIRIGTNQMGTDEAMVFQGIKEANRGTIHEEYAKEYNEGLESLLFGEKSGDGRTDKEGELSGEDAAYARLLLGPAPGDSSKAGGPQGSADTEVDFLINIVKVACAGLGTNTDMIWENVGKAAKQRDSGTDKEKPIAKAQLDALAKLVDDPKDPLDLAGITGELNAADLARLRSLLNLAPSSTDVPGGGGAVTVEVLKDPLVMRLRGAGGVEKGTLLDALMKLDAAAISAFADANKNPATPFHIYVSANSDVEEMGKLPTILSGSIYEKLRMSAVGWKKEEYANNLVSQDSGLSTAEERIALRQALRAIGRGEAPKGDAGNTMSILSGAFSTAEIGQIRTQLERDKVGVNERSAELDEDISRESSWWFGPSNALQDEKRQVDSDTATAGHDGTMTPEEEAKIREGQNKTSAALQDYIATRDEYTNYVSQAVSFAIGMLIAAGSAGAAGPAVMAALVRAAIASGLARAATEKALKGDRFSLIGPDGAAAFLNGAVDGAMNVVSAGMAQGLLKPIAGEAAVEALKAGTAGAGLRILNSSIEGGVSGAVGGTVSTMADDETWKKGVAEGITTVVSNAVIAGVQGAALSGGMEGAKVIGGKLVEGKVVGSRTGAGELFDAHPMVGLAKSGDPAACRNVLGMFGTWQEAIVSLEKGTGKASTMSESTRAELKKSLVKNRNDLVASLEKNFGAKAVGDASTELASDVDLNVPGDDAGKKLIEMRSNLDAMDPGWAKKYRMGLLVDASRVATYTEHLGGLPPREQAAARAQIARQGELYVFVRQIRGAEPEARPAMLEKLSGKERTDVEQLVNMDETARRSTHDKALKDGDALMEKLKSTTDPREKAEIGIKITEQQMLANLLNDDAYINPSAVGHWAGGAKSQTALDIYTNLLDQVEGINHQVHENHSVLEAMRRYEIFKYIWRYCELIEKSGKITGADADRITFFKNWAELLYRVEREATSSPELTTGPRNQAEGVKKAGVRDTNLKTPESVAGGDTDHAPRPGVTDRFLLSNYQEFTGVAERSMVAMKNAGQAELASSMGGDPAPARAPLVELPRLTGADTEAMNAALTNQGGVTASARPIKLVEQELRYLNPKGISDQIIGRPVASADDGRVIVQRLAAGDVKALHDIGVTNIPDDFDVRGKEWGLGRKKTGEIVIIEGGPREIVWTNLEAKEGIYPIAHSHPLTESRMLRQENRTLQQLSSLTGKDEDAAHIFPSNEDFSFTFNRGLSAHEVYTPYAHMGEGLVANPVEGKPLVYFVISGIEHVGNWKMGQFEGKVYQATLYFADTQNHIFDGIQVWAIDSPVAEGFRTKLPENTTLFEKPLPTGTVAPGLGPGSGVGQGEEERNKKKGQP